MNCYQLVNVFSDYHNSCLNEDNQDDAEWISKLISELMKVKKSCNYQDKKIKPKPEFSYHKYDKISK